jgi:UTP--glucose-1-phosphate uridylyltransferase
MEVFDAHRASVIAVQEVARADTRQYGIVKGRALSSDLMRIEEIVEKPAPENAPSTLGVVGRYLLTPRIFDYLEAARAGSGGEIQLTDAIAGLMREEQVLACRFQGRRYDCGSKLGYLEATVQYALAHGELGDEFRRYLAGLKL